MDMRLSLASRAPRVASAEDQLFSVGRIALHLRFLCEVQESLTSRCWKPPAFMPMPPIQKWLQAAFAS